MITKMSKQPEKGNQPITKLAHKGVTTPEIQRIIHRPTKVAYYKHRAQSGNRNYETQVTLEYRPTKNLAEQPINSSENEKSEQKPKHMNKDSRKKKSTALGILGRKSNQQGCKLKYLGRTLVPNWHVHIRNTTINT